MSVTILKTIGTWHIARAQEGGRRTPLSGRVITGMLTEGRAPEGPDPEAIDKRSEPAEEHIRRRGGGDPV